MKKLLLLAILFISVVVTGCGDKFAKDKEEILKAEKAALAMEVPAIAMPDYSKGFKKQDYEIYRTNFKKLLEVEDKIVAETRKSDAKIAELLKKAENDSEKKSLQEFQEKLRKDRIEFVRKVSKDRLSGDTFVVGVGSSWQEVEMVYGKPQNEGKESKGFKDYKYDGIAFRDWIGGGAYPANHPRLVNWKSTKVQSVVVTGNNITSDAGVKIGMTRDEVLKTLKEKYVKKEARQKEELYLSKGYAPYSKDYFDVILMYSMKDTLPYNIFPSYKEGKLVSYGISPH